MKKAIIVVLCCLNAALLTGLLFGATTPPAQAQVLGGGSDYMVVTGKVQSSMDGLYILDLATRQLKVWKYDKTRNRMAPIAKVDLKRDFGRKAEGQ